MASRKLRVTDVIVETVKNRGEENTAEEFSMVMIKFSRKLTQLEVSGVKAILEGEIK